ncbi:hypothetical protein [Herbaspirillum sp. alder98]|uniref:hypothetical protein n=1 Tax=Herbaspirillum sp. alder98 TaxID=2913096 RepID=UPI001CD8FC55|nr:hypothetical protein [Herbaspirillum sp. alder98]MCA1325537.1 hypothetical protein [Herbaspirillum sp. alder98]
MNDQHLFQELGTAALEPLQPSEKKMIGAVLFIGLGLLGTLFFINRYFPLGN